MPTPDLTSMLRGLIETPSISSTNPELDQSNQPVIEHLANWLEDTDFTVRQLPVPGHPGKMNLIATLGQGEAGLVLAGHSDTVPFDEYRWQHNPFKLTEKEGRLYGLGTSDMKSFLALAIEAAKTFDAAKFKHPLIILATADEETSMSGAVALCASDLSGARYAVIGEPTGLKPINLHKGILMEAISLRGQSGHSSDPSLGNNALEGMTAVMTELIQWRKELQQQNQNPAFAVPVPTLNLGHIHGGDNPNRICAECELHIDLRPLPGMSIEHLRKEIHQRVLDIAGKLKLQATFNPLFAGIEAMQTDASSPIVKTCEQLTNAKAGSVAFGTEGPYLKQFGIDTLILGPGDIGQAHQPDEYLSLDRIPPTIEILKNLIQKFCVEE